MSGLLCLGLGGILGAWSRYGLQMIIPAGNHEFPLSVMLINWIGCLFLGWFFTLTPLYWRISPPLRLGIGTGFTGAFTTFSTFSVDIVHLMDLGYGGTALLYMTASVGGGLLLSWAGVQLGMITGRQWRSPGRDKEGRV
ncbi:fluoride efflux transporter CrcB [Paenibacillus sp. JX-17]|uniref:Fluoride-specific ion channel FluC n=1 Tax=Paenibacillus lacisoli TaxID=3064525 RepID=A0ABT9CFQ2_9BACL|nr:fluoride efflux transporter CrcB [Paenibacillus sp. JX-17]MDO7908105.1 fluoride efflux transporter CrcB [Paenibacillus sp. JX-17]